LLVPEEPLFEHFERLDGFSKSHIDRPKLTSRHRDQLEEWNDVNLID